MGRNIKIKVIPVYAEEGCKATKTQGLFVSEVDLQKMTGAGETC